MYTERHTHADISVYMWVYLFIYTYVLCSDVCVFIAPTLLVCVCTCMNTYVGICVWVCIIPEKLSKLSRITLPMYFRDRTDCRQGLYLCYDS